MRITIQGPAERQFRIYYEYDNESVPLGRGGMGIVYEGTCHKVDNPNEFLEVAIKKVTTTDPDLIERARKEASIQLIHPNLVRMFGFIQNYETDPYTQVRRVNYYMVMERLYGINLEEVMNGKVSDETGQILQKARDLYSRFIHDRAGFVKTVMLPIMRGVNALHNAGFIHRDIDPSNAMVTEEGELKLIDFGIAKKLNSLGDSSHLTQTGTIIGKPEYAAPELITGDIPHHNKTTDIYSLGIMMFQFYTGHLPFSGDRNQIMQEQLRTPVPLKEIENKFIRLIIQKATQKKQTKRYQSVEEMIADLEAVPVAEIMEEEVLEPVAANPFVPVSEPEPDPNLQQETASTHYRDSSPGKIHDPAPESKPNSTVSSLQEPPFRGKTVPVRPRIIVPSWSYPLTAIVGAICGVLFSLFT